MKLNNIHPADIFLCGIVIVVVIFCIYVGVVAINKDRLKNAQVGYKVSIYIDPDNKCEYIISEAGGIVKRTNGLNEHLGCNIK